MNANRTLRGKSNTRSGWRRSLPQADSASGAALSGGALSFHRTPGPLLAVVGLCGGAGASVLAHLIAATAAGTSEAPVLLADTGGPTAGAALYSGACAPLTLADISERVAASERVPPRFWADTPEGLRILASEPQFTVQGSDDALRRVLSDARAVHGLTVIDAGTLARPAEQAALAAASHIAWVLPASRCGLERGERVLQRITRLVRPEILVARADPAGGKPPLGKLADLADARRAALVLLPHLGQVTGRPLGDLQGQAAVALQALGGLLSR
jgi:Flp pilus assembly CpaE family ATPase